MKDTKYVGGKKEKKITFQLFSLAGRYFAWGGGTENCKNGHFLLFLKICVKKSFTRHRLSFLNVYDTRGCYANDLNHSYRSSKSEEDGKSGFVTKKRDVTKKVTRTIFFKTLFHLREFLKSILETSLRRNKGLKQNCSHDFFCDIPFPRIFS